ncbi:MAG: fused MFS/spermidine synthase [Acidimicrobiia bacterium]
MRRWLVFLAVFVAAAAVLVLEIVAGRIMAPYVGVSLQTFTGIIGTVLAAIALGAWAGGRLADRHDPDTLLGPALMVGGVLAVVSPALVNLLGPSVGSEGPLAIVALAFVGFFMPAAVLSTVTPIAAKLSLTTLDATGSVVGQLSAVGTVGALFGTFITGFVLIASMPSLPITWVVGGVLVALGAILSSSFGKASVVPVVVLLVASVGASAAVGAPCDHETAYSCAIVTTPSGDPSIRLLILDTFVNSVVDVEDPTFIGPRYAFAVDAVVQAQSTDKAEDFLYIGGGGFALPRFYAATQGASATVLELDSAVPPIAVEELGLDPGQWLTTITGDARTGIREASGPFDVVVGDAFSGRSVPWHLTTKEYVADIKDRLNSGGVYVINVIDYPPASFARAELATLAEVFDHVAVVAPDAYLAGERGGNIILAGSDAPFDPEAIVAGVTHDEAVIVDKEALKWADDAIVLTDSFAPTDQLLTRP